MKGRFSRVAAFALMAVLSMSLAWPSASRAQTGSPAQGNELAGNEHLQEESSSADAGLAGTENRETDGQDGHRSELSASNGEQAPALGEAESGAAPSAPLSDDTASAPSLESAPKAEEALAASVAATDSAAEEPVTIDALAELHRLDLPDGEYMICPFGNGSVVVDVSAASAALAGLSAKDAQVWVVSHDSSGYVTFKNKATGLVLDVWGASSSNGARVQSYKANGTAAQRWIAMKGADGAYRVVSALSKDAERLKVLDRKSGKVSGGTTVQLYDGNATAAQTWAFADVTAAHAELDAAAEANRDVLPDGEYAIVSGNMAKRKVLDVAGASKQNKGNVQIYDSNATGAQRWIVSHDSKGYVHFKNASSGKMLDVSGGSAFPASNVHQYAANGTRAQQWIVTKPASGSYVISSALWPERVLDIRGGSTANKANAQLYTANGSSAQRFAFIDAAPQVDSCEDMLPAEGWFTLRPAHAPGLAVDIKSASTADGANAQLYSANGSFAQLFHFEYQANGCYLIRNAASGKVLDVAGGDVVPGANAQQWGSGSHANRLFSVSDNGDGTYTFVNKATGLALNAAGFGASSGTNLNATAPSGASSQRFKLVEQESLVSEGLYTIRSAANSSLALDVKGASTGNGANVQLYSGNGSFAQMWFVSRVSGKKNTYTFECVCSGKRLAMDASGNVCQRSASSDGSQQWVPFIDGHGIGFANASDPAKVIGVAGSSAKSGSNVQVGSIRKSALQRFRLKSTTATIANGTYFIRMAAASSHVLDVKGGSTSSGANVQTYSVNGTGAQKWEIKRGSDGFYTVTNAASGKALDVKSARAANKANVQQYASNGSRAQKWKIAYAGNGGFKLTSALDARYVLDVSGGSTRNGANVQLYEDNATSAQRFTFAKTTYRLSRSQLLNSLSNASNSGGITVFGGSYNMGSSAGKKLTAAVRSITSKYKIGFMMMDLTTGAGVASSPGKTFYVASSIKGPYVAAVNKYRAGSVTSGVKSTMKSTITVSSNEGYASLRDRFGTSPMSFYMAYAGVSGRWSASKRYPYMTSRDLAKLWVANYWYFYKETNGNSSWCRSLYTHSLNSPIYYALKGKRTVHSKPGWYPMAPYWVQNDAGIVMAGDRPYLISIMSSACGQYGKLQTLVKALDAVHADMVGNR